MTRADSAVAGPLPQARATDVPTGLRRVAAAEIVHSRPRFGFASGSRSSLRRNRFRLSALAVYAGDLKQLAAKQEQMAQSIATLQAVEQDLRQNISSVPAFGAVPIPRPKPTQPPAQSPAKQ
jgi:hypothetical protein